MAALLLFVLAVAGGVVVGDLVWENTMAAEVTVFGQPVIGYSQGWLLAVAASLGFVVAVLLVASVGATKGRRERRRKLRRLQRDRRQHRAEPEREYTSVLDQWFGHDDPAPDLVMNSAGLVTRQAWKEHPGEGGSPSLS